VKVVSNASPLIALARIGQLESLRKLYAVVHISTEVHSEVVTAGAGKPGASSVSRADWIKVMPVQDANALAKAISVTGLGAGETSAVVLATELQADLVLMDEWKGRRLATESGLAVVGCVGILEELYRRGEIQDLRQVYEKLLRQGLRIDLRTLQASLKQFNLRTL
jgi:predicted nucleic acid-binding protein